MSDEGVRKALADFCAVHKDLPIEAVNETTRIILDTIACGLGGHGVDKMDNQAPLFETLSE